MKSQVFVNFSLTILPVIGLLVFGCLFIGVCIWTFRSGSRSFYKKMADIPLNKEEAL